MAAWVPQDDQLLVIDIRDLLFRWDDAAPVVLVLGQLSIAPGEHIFIEGPSGSGKSTLLSLIAGVVTPQKGTIAINDKLISALSGADRDRFRADHIGFIYQMFNLIPYLSMVANVTLPCRFSRQRRETSVKRSGTPEHEALRLLDHLDMAHDELLDRPVTTWSGGQQQRVAAARALMGSPEIVIADEPTSSLDSNRREAFIQLLFNECSESGSTLVFVSHDESLQPLFDRRIPLAEVNRAGRPELTAE